MAIPARAGLSAFALDARHGDLLFDAMSVVALVSCVIAAFILAIFDPANIRGSRLLTRMLIGFVYICALSLAFDAARAADILLNAYSDAWTDTASDDNKIFVVMFALVSWLIGLFIWRANRH